MGDMYAQHQYGNQFEQGGSYPSGPSNGGQQQLHRGQQQPPPPAKKPSPQAGTDDGDEDGADKKDQKGGASEFVKKLYAMLEDPNFSEIVSWGYTNDSFVVKDMNSFTRSILPLHFKHSNFASFVRQLNKYDFHKVKNPEDGMSRYGEHTWEFKHPNFRADMKDNLEHIKRKAPAPRKSTPASARAGRVAGASGSLAVEPSVSHAINTDSHDYNNAFQHQIDGLNQNFGILSQHMDHLRQDYAAVTGEMMNFQRNLVAQDQLMQNLIQYLVNLEADQKKTSTGQSPTEPFVPSSQAQKLISTYTEVSRASYDHMADLSRRASMSNGALPPIPMPPPNFGQFEFGPGGQEQGGMGPPPPRSGDDGQKPNILGQGYSDYPNQNGQQQQLRPPQQMQQGHSQQQPNFPPQQHPHAMPPPQTGPAESGPPAKRPGYVPGWAVPPRVLLVEDDNVCRKLSSKFLQVFGCQIDVAVDGVSAVNKMNLQKYDLVLMDIVMPNLDGVSATSLIRQFDPMTPIISMTSNSGPNDIMTYFSHGMNDILPKPFTKEGLLGMLEKHLVHLKVMQQMAEIPRALGFSDNQIQDALAVSAVGDEGTVINPFSSMGISDADYVEMLQGIALEKEGKRGLEVVHDEREGKRARFQEVGEA